MTVELREVEDADLPVFFAHQQQPEAVRMAAFTHEDPSDRAAFDAHWARIRSLDSVKMKTIVADGEVVGSIGSFVMFEQLQVTYWIDRAHWGKGIATRALAAFLEIEKSRPIYGRAAADNAGSIRVLEKCGFLPFGRERGFANGRGQEIEEAVLCLA